MSIEIAGTSDVRVFDMVVEEYGECPLDLVVVECSDIARWILVEDPRKTFTSDDLPNCAPPFPAMFTEYTHPGYLNLGGKIHRDWLGSTIRIGVLSVYRELEEWIDECRRRLHAHWSYISATVDKWVAEFPDGDLKWICTQSCYFFGGGVRWPLMVRITGISKQGRLSYAHLAFTSTNLSHKSPEEQNGINECICTATNIAHLASSFMHCKNVSLQDGPPANRARRRYYQRKGQELTRYYTLNIEPMKKVLRGEGRSDELGIGKALHICRGHFANYTEDRPLFGRPGAVGQFWVPMHTRGSLAHGEVRKDYRVKAPRDCYPEACQEVPV
jgi:hypothetical protein